MLRKRRPFLRKSRFTEAQIVAILEEHGATGTTAEICRRHGIHANIRRNWKANTAALKSAICSA